MELTIAFISAASIMGALDYVWLGYIGKKIYYGEMSELLLKKPNMVPALIFYVIYVIGTVVFVIAPALEKNLCYTLLAWVRYLVLWPMRLTI